MIPNEKPEALLKTIKKIFVTNDNNEDVLIGLFEMLFPNWKAIKMMEGGPVCGGKLWAFINELFLDFDRKHHPESTAGDLWINYGFPLNADLPPWEIDTSECSITYYGPEDDIPSSTDIFTI